MQAAVIRSLERGCSLSAGNLSRRCIISAACHLGACCNRSQRLLTEDADAEHSAALMRHRSAHCSLPSAAAGVSTDVSCGPSKPACVSRYFCSRYSPDEIGGNMGGCPAGQQSGMSRGSMTTSNVGSMKNAAWAASRCDHGEQGNLSRKQGPVGVVSKEATQSLPIGRQNKHKGVHGRQQRWSAQQTEYYPKCIRRQLLPVENLSVPVLDTTCDHASKR